MIKTNKAVAGFSLLELLAVLVVVAVLAIISIPIYNSYVLKARFQNVVAVAESYKPNVAACIQKMGTSPIGASITNTNCPSYIQGNGAQTVSKGNVNTITIGTDGEITAAPSDGDGLVAADTYKLKPDYTSNTSGVGAVTWTATCANASLCE